MKDIYIVRWSKTVDDETECGNFEFCHTSEKEAVKAMLEDMNSTKSDVEDNIDEVDSSVEIDSCSLTVTHAGSGDVDNYNWWVDKVGIIED